MAKKIPQNKTPRQAADLSRARSARQRSDLGLRGRPAKLATVAMEPRKIKIRIIGLGGGGCSIAAEMSKRIKAVSFVLADTDSRVLKKIKAGQRITVFRFGEKILAGMGSGMNVELARQAALAEKEKIEKLFLGYDLVILVSALGGGVGSGALQVFTEAASNQKVLTLGFFTLPFEFEGEKKMALAKKTYQMAKSQLSGSLSVSNERIFKLVDKKTPLKKALSALNNEFAKWFQSLLDVILKPGLINIDFADLKTILKDRNQEIYFVEAESAKENKSEEILRQIFEQPLFAKSPLGADKILYCFNASKNVSLQDIEKISAGIFQLNPKARIIFGLNQLNNSSDRLRISLLAVSSSGKEKREKESSLRSGAVSISGEKKKKRTRPKKNKIKNKEKTSGRAKGLAILAKSLMPERKTAIEVKKAVEEEKEEEWTSSGQNSSEGQNWQVPAFLRKGAEKS